MGKKLYKGSFSKHFMIIYDRRQDGKVWHKLIDVLFIAVTATVCGFNEWEDMETWASEKEKWLWMKEVTQISKGTVIAIDGKTMRGTSDEKAGKRAIHHEPGHSNTGEHLTIEITCFA